MGIGWVTGLVDPRVNHTIPPTRARRARVPTGNTMYQYFLTKAVKVLSSSSAIVFYFFTR